MTPALRFDVRFGSMDGARGPQSLVAFVDELEVGYLANERYRGATLILGIEVEEAWQRRGIAFALLDELRRRLPPDSRLAVDDEAQNTDAGEDLIAAYERTRGIHFERFDLTGA
jgi:GNAT superfamily N-acetyltransferase